jgi:hypothetical protein
MLRKRRKVYSSKKTITKSNDAITISDEVLNEMCQIRRDRITDSINKNLCPFLIK